MSFLIAVPQWLVSSRRRKSKDAVKDSIEDFAVRLLERHKALFVPFAVGCVLTKIGTETRIVCEYGKLSERVAELGRVLESHGRYVEFVILHTEYQAAKWFDHEFVESYVKATLQALNAIVEGSRARCIELELHPGFSDDEGGRAWAPIISGMAEYVSRIVETVKDLNLELLVSIENRGSSAAPGHPPQAVALPEELASFRLLLEKKLDEIGAPCRVGMVVDVPQTVAALRKLRKRGRGEKRGESSGRNEFSELVQEALLRTLALCEICGERVVEIHVHWYGRARRTPHAPVDEEILDNVYRPILRTLRARAKRETITLVPEVNIGAARISAIRRTLELLDRVSRLEE